MRIGLLHPGEMGAAIGGLLAEGGHEVLWQPRGRSEETVRRADAARLTAVDAFANVEMILSICPPHAALEVASSLRGSPALVLDANAISPMTAQRVGELIGERWVDGGIVGPPPRRAGTTRLYLSGRHAGEVAQLFAGTRLEAVVLEGAPVSASALKLAYAAWTKGAAALLLSAFASSRAMGVEEALLAEWRRSQPDLEGRLASAASSAGAKGWRWTGEMQEIASMFAAAGLPPGFHAAAAEIFQRAPRTPEPALDDVVGALLNPEHGTEPRIDEPDTEHG